MSSKLRTALIDRPRLLGTTCCFGLLLVVGSIGLAADTARPNVVMPNVVMIVADDLGWADLGCYGSSFHRTPQLDRLAGESVRFAQAYAACPVCSPTRAAILTGRWPARLHLTDWLPGRADRPDQLLQRPALRMALPLEETTLAELLKERGYATASIGKWHLGGSGFEPTRQGFELNMAGDAAGTPLSYFAPFARDGRSMPGLEKANEGEYLADRLTDEAIAFIRSKANQPFFLYLPHFSVHTPMSAKPDLVAKYPPAQPFAGRQNNPIYAAMLESLDASVGRIVDTLREMKLLDNTLVIFTSDNGGLATREGPHTPATSNAPLREGKGYLYEGGIRVPLLVRQAGGARGGQVENTPVCSVDLLPTLAAACGLKLTTALDGVDLTPVLAGTGGLSRDTLYWHYPHYANQGGRPGGVIREGDYKLIEFYERGRRELFHLGRDPGEQQNLVEKEPEVARRLAEKLAAWRTSVDAQMPAPNPDYRPNPPDKEGRIEMHARSADVHGVTLRFEPLPHKDTLGYWVDPNDWASFEFTVTTPGTYRVEVWQGCGNGSGGSEVEFRCGDQTLAMQVEETGGFQNFKRREIGSLKFDQAGRYELAVRPRKKPGLAVMDLQRVLLSPK